MNVPEKLKKALADKGWTQKKLCQELKISENGLKNMIDNNSWKLDTLSRIADILDLPITYLISDSQENIDYKPKSSDGGAFGNKVLSKMADGIDELREFFEEELKAKNQQIASLQESQKGLQEMLKMILGKLEGAGLDQLFQSTGDVEADLKRYEVAAIANGILPMLIDNPIFLSPALAK